MYFIFGGFCAINMNATGAVKNGNVTLHAYIGRQTLGTGKLF